MKGLPRITGIIKVEPFKVTVRWTTGEIRVLDFADLLVIWHSETYPASTISKLLEYETFRYVSISESRTLYWPTVLLAHLAYDESGKAITKNSPLTLDPDVLYQASRPIEAYRLVPMLD